MTEKNDKSGNPQQDIEELFKQFDRLSSNSNRTPQNRTPQNGTKPGQIQPGQGQFDASRPPKEPAPSQKNTNMNRSNQPAFTQQSRTGGGMGNGFDRNNDTTQSRPTVRKDAPMRPNNPYLRPEQAGQSPYLRSGQTPSSGGQNNHAQQTNAGYPLGGRPAANTGTRSINGMNSQRNPNMRPAPSMPQNDPRSSGATGQSGHFQNTANRNLPPTSQPRTEYAKKSPDPQTLSAYNEARRRETENTRVSSQETRMDRLNASKSRSSNAAGVPYGRRNDSNTKDKESSMSGNSRKSKKNKKQNTKKRKILKIIGSFILACFIVAVVFVVAVIATAPKYDPDEIYSMLSQSSVLYDDNGQVVDSLLTSEGMRTNVTYDQLPKNLVNAFISIEDKTFWKHHGFNFVRILGAIKESVFHGGNISGTSTITQQLARNLYLSETKSDYSFVRKIREAYYAVMLEQNLTKEQIIEAYLNTIYLGYSTSGVQAASKAYFSKDVSELTLPECAALASLAKAPDRFALIKKYNKGDVDANDPNVLYRGDTMTFVYNDASKDRRELVLKSMKEQGMITDSEYNEAMSYDLRNSMHPSEDTLKEASSYYIDYVLDDVVQSLIDAKIAKTEAEAHQMLYNNGLQIYTTLNQNMQNIVETEFSNNADFPSVYNLHKDNAGNIIDKSGRILLYAFGNYFDSNGTFTLAPDEYSRKANGDLVLNAGKRLKFIKVTTDGKPDYNIEFKDLYVIKSKTFYTIQGGVIQVPQKYKKKDSNGNLIIKKEFFDENPGVFAGNNPSVSSDHYTLRQEVVQPQAAMVVYDYHNGQIKAMVGGRNIKGRLLYNRALSPRQPGSSIKPIGAYGPALQMGVDGEEIKDQKEFKTKYWTAATAINDEKMMFNGKVWPKNWYTGYRGLMRMRVAIEQSVNTCAVKVVNDIGIDRSIAFAKKLGISTIVESGAVNDKNAAAMALGGMTHGVKPLEMAAAYGAFANSGVYMEPISFTKITNRKGEVILDNENPEEVQAMDPGVAYIMTDMLRTTVTEGIAKRASLGTGMPVAGKTGTTTDNYDAWFVGYTPYYAASVWVGNDINIELDQGSDAPARIFSKVMKQIHEGLSNKSFPEKPSDVISMKVDARTGLLPNGDNTVTENFIKGTQPTTRSANSGESATVTKEICADTGLLATPDCPNKETKEFPAGSAPTAYCYLHNPDPAKYPPPNNTNNGTTDNPGNGTGSGVTTPPSNTDQGGNTGSPPQTAPTEPPPTQSPPPSEPPSWINM